MLNTIDISKHPVRIWDLPTRLFHWLLVLAFILAWLTQGESRYLDIHVFSGYLFLGLLIFRLVWGFIGSDYAHFRHFMFSWRTVQNYLKTLFTAQRQHFLGHNPAGSWAVFLMLGLSLIVSLTGLLTLGGEEQHGLLAGFIHFAWGEIYHQWHDLTAWLLLGLVGIHLLGVLIESALHHENLVKAMVSGSKIPKRETLLEQPLKDVPQHRLVALCMIFAIIVGSGSYFKGYFMQTDKQPYLPFIGPELPHNAHWNEACGECHLAYHPTLLPARSWQRMLAEQHNHFEEDLDLDEDILGELRQFSTANAAESILTEAAWKIQRTTSPLESPLRITETPYWQTEHQNIADEIWQHPDINFQGNCGVCHLDAERGTFEDSAMHLPSLQNAEKKR
jgi:cytochrome b